MSNSPLVTYKCLSPHNSGARPYAITRITPHCVVGQASVESLGRTFSCTRKASCNYGIGWDGKIGMYVPENYTSWCSSSLDNDKKSVTIECASENKYPYRFNEVVYQKLIDLCTDICKRHKKTRLVWISDKTKSLSYAQKDTEILLTVHRWFANKSCPGDWMYQHMAELASVVTNRLASGTDLPNVPFKVRVSRKDLNIRKGNGVNFQKVKMIDAGIYTIVDVAEGKGSTLGWGKLKSGIGWISLDFVTLL